MRKFIILMCLGLAVPSSAGAFTNEPDGFGAVKFGASAAAAKAAFPDITHKGTETFLSLYELRDQTVFGLQPCALELRFADDQLYEIQFACEPRDKVAATLRTQFGEPSQVKAGSSVWMSERRTVGVNPAGLFSFSDRNRAQTANQKLLRYIIESQARATVSPTAPTPAATVRRQP